MTVTVTPETFAFVEFDAAEITAIVEKLIPDVGLGVGTDIALHVDEKVPMGRADIVSLDPIALEVEGGALENPKVPRHLSVDGASDVLGRLLLRVRDHLDAGFGAPTLGTEIELRHKVAWDVYCVARLTRKGYRAQKQRRLYSFRNRHGFTDSADAAFEKIWTQDDLMWVDLQRISDEAHAARDSVTT
jgi:hypothetical protein